MNVTKLWTLRGAHSAFDSNPELCVAGPSIPLADAIEVVPKTEVCREREAREAEMQAVLDAVKEVCETENPLLSRWDYFQYILGTTGHMYAIEGYGSMRRELGLASGERGDDR